jgi:hypothetical protein
MGVSVTVRVMPVKVLAVAVMFPWIVTVQPSPAVLSRLKVKPLGRFCMSQLVMAPLPASVA